MIHHVELKQLQLNHKLNKLIQTLTYDLMSSAVSEEDGHSTEVKTLALKSIQTDKSVLKIGYPTRKCVDAAIESQTAAIFLDNNDEFSVLKIRRFFPVKNNKLSSAPDYLITLVSNNGSKEWYFVTGNEFKKIIDELIPLAQQNNQVNFYPSKGMVENYPFLMGVNYWSSNWERKGIANYYDKINDPLIVESFQSWLETIKPTLESTIQLSIFSPGSGKGRLDEKLIQCLLTMGISFHYTLLEPSVVQMNIAKQKLQPYQSQDNKISFLTLTLEEAIPILNDKVDCIVLSGGPVNLSIVTRQTARANAEFLQNLLKDDGRMIITGMTAVIIKPKDLPKLSCQQYAKPISELVSQDLVNDPTIAQSVQLSFFGYEQSYVYVKKKEMQQAVAFDNKNCCNIS